MDASQLLKRLPRLSAPEGLTAMILEQVRFEERRAARRAVAIAVPVVLASFGGMVWGIVSAFQAFSESGFFQFASLLLSDTGTIASFILPFALTLLETLPLFALTILVGALLAFIGSTAVAVQNSRRAFSFA